MLNYHFLLDLAIILLSTKVLGVLTKKIQMPQVVGALLAGLILGPAFLGMIHETEFIKQLAEIGVIVLMFSAGLDTDLNELKHCGKASLIIALFGVIVPLVAGFGIALLFNNNGGNLDTRTILENVFIGVVLTATSVSITVETLQELGKLNTRSGTAILGAALIDDVLGIIILTIITSTAGTSGSSSGSSSGGSSEIVFVLLRIAAFFVVSAIIGALFFFFFNKYSRMHDEKRRFVIIAFSFCLAMSFMAEHFFGVADITGAFIAGVIISTSQHSEYIHRRFEITSYMLLSPIFFASIGISATITGMNTAIIIFSVALLLIAVVTKIAGCYIGAVISRFSKKEALQVGVGMVSRGEVALIVATKGASVGLLKSVFFAPIILMVVTTTIITPILLKLVYRERKLSGKTAVKPAESN